MSEDQIETRIAALRDRLISGTLDSASQQQLARLEDQLAIERLIDKIQGGYRRAFELQSELDDEYESCKAAIEQYTVKWGEPPNTKGKLGRLKNFPNIHVEPQKDGSGK